MGAYLSQLKPNLKIVMPLAMRRTGPRRASSSGFTLVELMVVVAVSSILMALLLPALSKAKEKSRRSVCTQNLRQNLLALEMYSRDFDDLLPSALDNQGNYHSIVLASTTYSNLVEFYLSGVSNTLYCPNLVSQARTMAVDPGVGIAIGYHYLALVPSQPNPKGPNQVWSGPDKNDGRSEVFADANYWSQSSSVAMTAVPHRVSGGHVAALARSAAVNSPSPSPSSPVAGAASIAFGAAGGNVGMLDTSVIWKPIRSLNQYSASSDNSAAGNW